MNGWGEVVFVWFGTLDLLIFGGEGGSGLLDIVWSLEWMDVDVDVYLYIHKSVHTMGKERGERREGNEGSRWNETFDFGVLYHELE